MTHIRTTNAIALMILLAVLPGCSSKKENADQVRAPHQVLTSASKTPTKADASNPVDVVASPQDEADAAILKKIVLAHLKAGDFSAIYKEASAGFREVGQEQQFVALWQKQLQQTGAFKDAKEVSHTVRPQDKFLVFIYRVQYEKASRELRLTFGRSKKGKMELTGINQREIK